MSAHITRLVATGAAVLALVVVTGCGSTKQAPAASKLGVPTTSAPSVSQTPTAAPSGTMAPSGAPATSVSPAPVKPPAGSTTLAKAGAHKFGEAANVAIDSKGGWIGALKVTALEKAPKSDYKELGLRDDAGSVYYLRYDITYVSGKTSLPPEGADLNWTKLTPLRTQDQRLQLSNQPGFDKCSTLVRGADGNYDRDKMELKLGETATNMCLPYVVDKGTLAGVNYIDYNDKTNKDLIITWK